VAEVYPGIVCPCAGAAWHLLDLHRPLTTPMPRKPKTGQQKMQAQPPHTVRLDKDFSGVPAGSQLPISSPQ